VKIFLIPVAICCAGFAVSSLIGQIKSLQAEKMATYVMCVIVFALSGMGVTECLVFLNR
jgi:uncharacterized membrane protein